MLPFSSVAFMHGCILQVNLRQLGSFQGTVSITNTKRRRYITPIKMSVIEVERKFEFSPEIKNKLAPTCINKISTKVFRDCYYSKSLALSDKWLRNRNGVWELKVPCDYERKHQIDDTIYREISGNEVWDYLGFSSANTKTLELYAKITTKRTQISVNRNGQDINLVLDECYAEDGFQCSLGEAEILVNDVNDVDRAIGALDEIVKSLDLSLIRDNEGKLLQYLKYSDRPFYDSLWNQTIVTVSKQTFEGEMFSV